MPSLETTTTPPPPPLVEEPKADEDSVRTIENLSNQEEEENNNDSDGSSDSSDGEKDEYIMVKLTKIRKEVQCHMFRLEQSRGAYIDLAESALTNPCDLGIVKSCIPYTLCKSRFLKR